MHLEELSKHDLRAHAHICSDRGDDRYVAVLPRQPGNICIQIERLLIVTCAHVCQSWLSMAVMLPASLTVTDEGLHELRDLEQLQQLRVVLQREHVVPAPLCDVWCRAQEMFALVGQPR